MALDQEDYHYRFKIVVLGDVKSGKSTFLDSKQLKINYFKFNPLLRSALTQSNGKVIELETSEEISERVSLHVNDHLLFKVTYWEIPGKERHLRFLNNYCVGAAVAIILFDTTKQSSLEKAEKLLQSIETCDIPFKILLGNKVIEII
jgi:signal recognition particle receptor subunit beta